MVSSAARLSPPRNLGFLLFALCLPSVVSGALLENQLPGNQWLSATARLAVGPWARPGSWAVMVVTVENESTAFDGRVSIRNAIATDHGVLFNAPSRTFSPGATNLDVSFSHTGRALGWHLEIAAASGAKAGRTVFRADLSPVMKLLSFEDRFVLTVGLRTFPVPAQDAPGSPRIVSGAIEARDMPLRPRAYSSVDAVVIEQADGASETQAEALATFVRGGGRAIFASYRAMSDFDRAFPGLRTELKARALQRSTGLPARAGSRFGFGDLTVFAAEAGDPGWNASATADFLRRACGDSPDIPWIDTAARAAFTPDKPFSEAASAGRSAAILGAVIASVVIVLIATRGRRAVLLGLCAFGAAASLLVMLLFAGRRGAVRNVRVRLFSADGRAEVATSTAALFALGSDTEFEIISDDGPLRPIAPRSGDLGNQSYSLSNGSGAWELAVAIPATRGAPLVRSRDVNPVDPTAGGTRARLLAHGHRWPVPPGRGRYEQLAADDPALSTLLRYVLGRLPPGQRAVCWLWDQRPPEGIRAEGLDPAPGSGTLLVGMIPAGVSGQSDPAE